MEENEYLNFLEKGSGSTPEVEKNEYLDALGVEDKINLQTSLNNAVGKPADKQAEYLRISKELKVPMGLVERNYDTVYKDFTLKKSDPDNLIAKNPSVSNWLSKPENAAIGHDDIDGLKKVESYSKFRVPEKKKTFRETLESSLPAQYVPAVQTGMNNLVAGTVALAHSAGRISKDEAADYIANLASLNKDIQKKIPSFAREFQDVMAKEGSDVDAAFSEMADKYYNLEKDFGLNALKEFGSGASKTIGESLEYAYELGSRGKGLAYMSIENLTRMTPNFVLGGLSAYAGGEVGALIAGSTGPLAPGAVIPGAATGALIGGASGYFIGGVASETGAWMQDKILQRVKDPTDRDQIFAALSDEKFMAEIQGEAIRKGVATAAIDTLFSAVAGGFLSKSKIGQTKGVLAKTGVIAKEGSKELGVQTLGELASEGGGQAFAYEGDLSKISPSDVLAEGVLSLGTSSVDIASGVSRRAYYDTKSFKAAEQVAKDTKIAFESAQNAEMLDQLNGAIVESKVSQRSPEALGELISSAVQGQAEAVFFQVDDWDSYWTSRGESPAQKLTEITGDPTLHQRVRNEGVDLSLPIKDYMTKLAGTEDINQLNKLARVSPDSMNLAEAREHFKDLNATVKEIASEADAQIAEVNKAKEMQDRFYNEYKATGVSPQQAKSYAVMNTAFYETMASRLGLPLDELYKLYPLRISPETAQVESVGEFSQDANKINTPEFKNWFKESKVVDEKGEPLVVYHGTNKNFKSFEKMQVNDRGYYGEGFYFTPQKGDASFYAELYSTRDEVKGEESAPNIMPVYLSLQKPFVVYKNQFGGPQDPKEFTAKLKEKGYDGVIVRNRDVDTETNQVVEDWIDEIVVFDNKKIKSINNQGTFDPNNPNILFQSSQAPAFYSKLRKTISEKLQGKSATVDQVKALLKDIKAEEVEWTGINEFLKGKKKVDTQELLNYLDANQVNIQPVVLGEATEDEVRGEYYIDEGPEGSPFPFAVKDWAGNNIESFKTEEEAESFIESRVEISLPTKYEQYTLPGGENYREVLFTLPVEPIRNDMPNFDNWAKEKGLDPATAARDWELEGPFKQQYLMELGKSVESKEVFRSSHFDEKNILAHVRLNDRTDKDGNRVLFVEEIQSDWHQAGRKKGYKGDKVEAIPSPQLQAILTPEDITVRETQFQYLVNPANRDLRIFDSTSQEIAVGKGVVSSESDAKEYALKMYNRDIEKRNEKIQRQYDEAVRDNRVPKAPFKKTWHEFAFKNIIRMAAEGNYDKIAWTTGEQQANRYKEALLSAVSDIEYKKNDDGTYNVQPYKDGNKLDVGSLSNASLNDIENIYGKDITEKIERGDGISEDNGSKTLDTPVLSIGGEGMKGFYDKILVQYANKLGKKMDAKVEELAIGEDDGTGKASVWNATKNKFEPAPVVHSIPVTNKMKEIALGEGFELFQEGKRGKITFFKSEEARRGAVVELMKAKNFSTALHESGHFFLEVMADLYDQDNTPQEIKDDFKIVMDWMGITDRSQIGVEQHEMWAETVEAYFMTGNAPSNRLKKIFNQFKAWLVSIYRNLGPQRAKLNPEIKSVMDRLLATEIELEQAKDQMNFKPMFGKDLEKFGLTGEKATRYKDAVIAAEDAASEILTARLLNTKKVREQKEWKEKEQAEREAVTEQVNSLKVYKTIDAIKEKREDGTNLKLSKDSLLQYIEKEDLKKLTGLYAVEGGMDVAEASGLFGYADSIEMIDDLLKSGKKKEVIDAMTQARMNEKYPEVDPFFDENKMNEESLSAIHNEHREKLMSMELDILFEQNKPVVKDMIRQTSKRPPKSSDVKAIAEKIIGKLTLENIRPIVYERSEAKAAKLAGEALARGDFSKAYEYKKKEQINYYLYKESIKAKEEIKKAKKSFKKLNKKDSDLAKTRDVNFVNAARALLAKFGIGRLGKTSQEYLASMKSYDEAAYDTMINLIESIESNAPTIDQMTFEEFKVLKDTVDALLEMAKTSREIEVDGKKMRKEDAIAQLSEIILMFSKPGVRPGYEKAMAKWDKAKMSLLSTRSALRRVESFFDALGEGNAFKRILFYPIKEAVNSYRSEKVKYIKEFRELLRPIEKSLTGKEVKGSEINYTFKDKAELLGAMLHTGNISNKQKLLRGRGWGELDENKNLVSDKWDKFVERMIKEGQLTKADFDFMQNVWDLFERTKPMAQKAHKAMYGHYFDEVTSDSFEVNIGGEVLTYRGGYMPAKADPNIVEDASIRQEKDSLEKFNNSYAFPTTGRGATKKRVEEYAAPLIFDLRQVPQHLDWVLRFSIVEPRVKDAAKIVMDGEFRNTLAQLDPTVGSSLLVPWLQRAATQVVEEPVKKSSGWDFISKGSKVLRSRTGLGIMMGNVVNTFQQVTGFSIASLKVDRKYLRNAAWRYFRDSKTMGEDIVEKSSFMNTRVATQVFDVSREVEDLLINPTKYEIAKDFAAKHGYFLQQHAQNVVDSIVWSGAYEQAVESGKDEKQAVRDADEAVRLTQGSFDPEDLSTFESGSPLQRFFTMFYSYFNMQANLLGTEFVKIMRNGGIGMNKGRAMYVYTMGFMIPAVVAELIVKGMSGNLDEDDDDEYLDDVMGLFIGSQIRTGTAMFPIVGPAIQTGINSFNDKWYDDRISTSPAVSMLESTVRAPYSVYKVISDGKGEKRAVRDTLTAIQMITGLPTMTLSRPTSYLLDVERGKAKPSGPVDFTRGLITGKSGE